MLLTDSYRDGPTPDKQIEQILAIYHILKGQRRDTRNSIPPRGSISGPSSHPPSAEQPPVEHHPSEQRTAKPPAADLGGDLIDFGQDDAQPPAPKQPEPNPQPKLELKPEPEPEPEDRPALDDKHKSTAEIQSMLSQTGSPAPGGPLIDFHQDLNTTLPAGLKKADTAESSDEFVDAHE
jgi:hypothetical protein